MAEKLVMSSIHDCHNTGLELRRHCKLEETEMCAYQIFIVCSTEHFIYYHKESKFVESVLISARTLVVYP